MLGKFLGVSEFSLKVLKSYFKFLLFLTNVPIEYICLPVLYNHVVFLFFFSLPLSYGKTKPGFHLVRGISRLYFRISPCIMSL